MASTREQLGVTSAPILSDIDTRLRYTDSEMVLRKNEEGVKGIPISEIKSTAGDDAENASSKTVHSLGLVIASNINDANKHGILPWDRTLAESGQYGASVVVKDRNGILKQLKVGGNVTVDPDYDTGLHWDILGSGLDNEDTYGSFDDNSILGLRHAGEISVYNDIRSIPIFNADGQFYNGLNIQLLPTDLSQEILTPRNHTGMRAVVNGCNGTMRSKVVVNTENGAEFNVILYFTSNDTEITSYLSLADLSIPRTYVENTDLTIGDFISRIGVTDLVFKSHWKMESTNTYNGIINENGFNDYNQDLLTNRTRMSDYVINAENTKISYANNFDSITQKETSLTDATHIGRRTRIAYVNGSIIYFIEYWSEVEFNWISQGSGIIVSDNLAEWTQADYDDDKYTILTMFKIPHGIAIALNLASLATDPVGDNGTHYHRIMDEAYLAANFLTEAEADAKYPTETDIAAVYLKKADASTTYLNRTAADATYRSKIELLQSSDYADRSVADSKLASTFRKTGVALTNADYGSRSIADDKLASTFLKSTSVLGTANYGNNTVTDAKLSSTFLKSNAVLSTSNYGYLTVTNAKIASRAITSAKIGIGAVIASNIQDYTITADQIAGNTITGAEIASGAVDTSELANSAVTGSKIASGAVGSVHLGSNSVETYQIRDGTVTPNKLDYMRCIAASSMHHKVVAASYQKKSSTYTNFSTYAVICLISLRLSQKQQASEYITIVVNDQPLNHDSINNALGDTVTKSYTISLNANDRVYVLSQNENMYECIIYSTSSLTKT